ncbi:hypothetical protein ACHAWF_002238 [Thalassiosira exigua]
MSLQPASRVTKKASREVFEVQFDNFFGLRPDLIDGHGFVESPEFECFGHQWCLRLFPRGTWRNNNEEVWVCLSLKSGGNIKIWGKIYIKQAATTTRENVALGILARKFYGKFFGERSWGRLLIRRSEIGGFLTGGDLILVLKMAKAGEPKLTPFIPQNPLSKMILEKFMDESSADVVFEVGGGCRSGVSPKRAKASPTTFYAHRFILQECSPILAELCTSEEGLTPITISDIEPYVFRHLLFYIYGGEVGIADMEANAKNIIDAADKFGVVNLKVEAEACYVKRTQIDVDNMLENILYADSKNCALLKEAVMDFIVENGDEVEEKVSFKDIPSGLFVDLLNAMNRGKKKDAGNDNGTELSKMRVDDLRKKLSEKGLAVDGSREAMVASLKENP